MNIIFGTIISKYQKISILIYKITLKMGKKVIISQSPYPYKPRNFFVFDKARPL